MRGHFHQETPLGDHALHLGFRVMGLSAAARAGPLIDERPLEIRHNAQQ